MVAAVIDTNKNGVIEFNEFCDWFVEEMLDRPEEEGFVAQYVRATSICGCLTGWLGDSRVWLCVDACAA